MSETRLVVRHERGCPWAGKGHSDAARRVRDTYGLHRTAGLDNSLGRWFAAALADGETDGNLYSSKAEAIAHQHHNESYYTYIQVTMANMNLCSAEVMIDLARRLYDKGLRMSDPGVAKRDVITRMNFEDMTAYLRGKPTNVIFDEKGEYQ